MNLPTRGDHVRHPLFEGVALWYVGPAIEYEDDGFGDVEAIADPSRSIVIMVGDDRRHVVDTSGLQSLNEDDFCGGCGQIGCGHG